MFDLKFVVSLILCIKCGVIYPTKNSLRLIKKGHHSEAQPLSDLNMVKDVILHIHSNLTIYHNFSFMPYKTDKEITELLNGLI